MYDRQKIKEKILCMKEGEHIYVSPFDAKIEYENGMYELFELKCFGDGPEFPCGRFSVENIDEMIAQFERWT